MDYDEKKDENYRLNAKMFAWSLVGIVIILIIVIF